MPDQFGREWMTTEEWARRLGKALLEDERMPQQARDYLLQHKAVALQVLQDAMVHAWLGYEFKILRLTEKVKGAIAMGAFGPLVIPNTVDVEGLPIQTPVGEIHQLFRDIYDPDFLDQFDEDGEPLDNGSAGG